MWIVCAVVLLKISLVVEPSKLRPVVIWHGLSDSCCDPNSAGRLKEIIQKEIANVFVLSLQIGKNTRREKINSWMENPYKQVDKACKVISSTKALEEGYNAVGMSQGAQFLRALVQRCPTPRMYNLISLGGQHQGIFGIDETIKYSYFTQPLMTDLGMGKILGKVTPLVPLQYWHDPTSPDEEQYRRANNFIAEINNEKVKKQDYIDNLQKLENLVLVKYRFDKKVIPVASQWFEFYKPGQSEEILPLELSRLWLEDRIGLRALSEKGGLHFIEHEEAGHLKNTDNWLKIHIIDKFLK